MRRFAVLSFLLTLAANVAASGFYGWPKIWDFEGARISGYPTYTTGAALELGYTTNAGFVTAYDRGTSTWKGLNLRGNVINFDIDGNDDLAKLTTATFTLNGATSSGAVFNAASGSASSIYFQENGNNKGLFYADPTNHWLLIRKYQDAAPGSVSGQIYLYDSGALALYDAIYNKALKLESGIVTTDVPSVKIQPTTATNTGIEIGAVGPGSAVTSHIDLHSSASNTDYDVRLSSTGGTASLGQGPFSIASNGVYYNSERQDSWAGRVSVSGTTCTGTRLPTGWSLTYISTGRCKVTNNIGTDYATVCTSRGIPNMTCSVISQDVNNVWLENQSAGTAANGSFDFIIRVF